MGLIQGCLMFQVKQILYEQLIIELMIEKCMQSYIDNQLLNISEHQLSNEFILHIEEYSSNIFSLNGNNDMNHNIKLSLKVYGWTLVSEFKDRILGICKVEELTRNQLRLFNKNIQLIDDDKTLLDYNLNNGSYIVLYRRNTAQFSKKPNINAYKLFQTNNPNIRKLLDNSIQAIDSDIGPVLSENGSSGVYLIKNKKDQFISIFKPFDQEVNAPNNPRCKINKLGSEGTGRSKGILSGESATREVAAYLLDSEGKNYHGVPTTTYVEFYHPVFMQKQIVQQNTNVSIQQPTMNVRMTKHGSLQQYVCSEGIIENYGCGRLSVEQVHKIAILDIRILNCDRNQENILVKEQQLKCKLIPIDHGLSFPDSLQIYEQCVIWMSFPHAKKQFSEQELNFIQQINPEKDEQILRAKLGFRQICLRNIRIAQILLKKAAGYGFTLFEIGKMIYRTEKYEDETGEMSESKRSNLETIVMQAQNLYLNAMELIEKQNIEEQLLINSDLLSDNSLDDIEEQSNNQSQKSTSNSGSNTTCNSIKSILYLKKKSSLPELYRKNTGYHELRYRARKQREGVNGISKNVWNKYHQEEWNQVFYYYLENLIDTMLVEKSMSKRRKLEHKCSSSK